MNEPTAIFITSEDDYQELKTKVANELFNCWFMMKNAVENEDYERFSSGGIKMCLSFKEFHPRKFIMELVVCAFKGSENFYQIANNYRNQFIEEMRERDDMGDGYDPERFHWTDSSPW